ncbi:DUF397 domain-containing protein [Sphaerisporangium corydalis]|uniref:DUF397 domain-containing protein n=1 Tax=Sphaerisporangium corydalis TaxID=1441875 RepID=A0ABV9E5E2_9ACTN|nr:DUF397 domain-containing protein [Sphaerisporangium corydalis]
MDKLTQDLRAATWITSSHSGSNGGNCVEVATLSNRRRGVRDSKNSAGPALVVTGPAWDAFIRSLDNDDFRQATL